MPQYSTRAQSKRRGSLSPVLRQQILQRDAGICFYCEFEAEEVDHIVPYTYGGGDDPDNLVACCSICNKIANNQVFDSLEAKRAYIRDRYGPWLEKRVRRMRRKLSVCADCRCIYNPQQKGSTVVLCADCYRLDELGVNGTMIDRPAALFSRKA